MKSTFKRIIAISLAVLVCLAVTACAEYEGQDQFENEQVDTSKTQLYVFNFNGGYGAEWLGELKVRYEELHKDDVYEEGKKGIQIIVNNNKGNAAAIADQILSNREEVYFTEYAYYYALMQQGILGDITDAVTGDMSAYGDPAGTTILSKMTEEQKNFYGVTAEDGQTHYYGIPHYAGYAGIMYNVDLFEQEGYYFADGVTEAEYLEDWFIIRSTDKKSAGPDGQYDTMDDGLPATTEEFFLLCEYIASRGHTPVSWMGKNSDYLKNLLTALQANYEGVDQMMLNYTMNGTATSLGSIFNGKFVKDKEATVITGANGHVINRQAGKYYALDFLETLVSTEKYMGSYEFQQRLFPHERTRRLPVCWP